jgi:1-phosphofructokinase
MPPASTVITVSLNPAIDRVLEVEGFTIGAHQPGRELRRTPGGKAVNVSRALACLGVRSIATGFLGEENRSDFASFLSAPLVVDQFFPLAGRTRENVTIADPRTHQETHIRDAGLAVCQRDIKRLATKLHLIARQDNIVIFSGSLPPGMTPQDFSALIDSPIAAGAHVAVDTTGAALRAMAGKRLWLLKPNAAELAELIGRPISDLAGQIAAARELARTVKVVLFTRGAQGAWLFSGPAALHGRVDVPPDKVRNTVGCGDALLAAFVAGVARGESMPAAFAEAVATASASACTVGPAEFDPAYSARLRQTVQLTDV